MSSKLEPMIWLLDTGHIGIHGGVERRMVTKTKSRIDGLPYFLNYGVLRVWSPAIIHLLVSTCQGSHAVLLQTAYRIHPTNIESSPSA